MPVEDDEAELLFLLEVVVDSVTLEDKVMTVADAPLRVGIKFIGYCMIEIKQEAFSDVLTTSKYGGFSSGQSIMFAKGPRQLLASIEESPLILTVFRQLPQMVPPDILGNTSIRLSDIMGEMIHEIIERRAAVPAARFLQGMFPLIGLSGERLGEISIFVRLSCLGQTVLSQVQILRDQAAYLFKSVPSDCTLTATGLPEDLKMPRLASPKESYLNVQSVSSPFMYSLEEAHHTRHDDTAINCFRSMARDRVQQTMNHILYELDQIGDVELPPFRAMPCHTDAKVPSNAIVPSDVSLLYKLSDMQKIMDVKTCYETSEVDLQEIQEGVQSGRPLFYCTPKNEFENEEKELLRGHDGLPSGAGQAPIFRKSMLSLTQHRRISTSARNGDTTCTCKESSNWWQTPQNHFDKSTGVSDKQSVTPLSMKYHKSSFACDDGRKWHAQNLNASNTHVPKNSLLTPAQQKQTHQSTIETVDACMSNYSRNVRACPRSPNLTCACSHFEGTHLPQSEVVCFPLGPRLPAPGASLRADNHFSIADQGTETVIWRIPDDLGCACTDRRLPEPSHLYTDSLLSVPSPIGIPAGPHLPELNASRSYTPVSPPVRYDTTGRLSPAGRGEMPVETRAHPPVR
ncbi:hypothetical protein PR048_030510 [Dryococelus australis]|uniref:Uncharacterized protein n=1 Tax=Dryococelus australis TaxID=614101 RepID=A0ABQ9G961_9NEOP|nr:hypothetical protein PR048_030510 [Dryococelus australis]